MSYVVFENVCKKFGDVEVVRNFCLEIHKEEFVSILGPSGCGKTTCLRMLAGLERNSSGSISIEGELLSCPEKNIYLPPEDRSLGMVFQSYAIWPHMNVFENVAYPLRVQKKSFKEIQERVFRTIELVELEDYHTRMPNKLSGGQQQRVALARGLVMEPRVLLLDEPLSNLDAKLRGKMRKDIRSIQQKTKTTVLYVTHDQLEAITMSDRIVIMSKGKIEQVGIPEEIKENPKSEFVADFLS